jgi:hypothetical protein
VFIAAEDNHAIDEIADYSVHPDAAAPLPKELRLNMQAHSSVYCLISTGRAETL